MSAEAAVAAAPRAVEATAKGLVGLVKAHPFGALVVFTVCIVFVLRFRTSIVRALNLVPYAGPRAAAFAVGPTTTSTGA